MTKEEITTFAPVSIPTLCRFEHFKRCIESLSRCTWAEYTDVYVALDYPAKESHWEGYKKIKAYLDTCGNMTFKSLNVVIREKNYGIGSQGNMATLNKGIRQKYDRYIITEDDNEFSPNFLVFMNKALEKFKDDDRISHVCGFNRNVVIPEYYKNNYYLVQNYAPWGIGVWTRKTMPEKYYSIDFYKELLADDQSYQLLKERSPSHLEGLMFMLKKGRLVGDLQICLYQLFENKYNIRPTLSKVRNHGTDGTGVHSPKKNVEFNNFYENQLIDESTDFDFGEDIFVMQPDGIIIPHPPVSKYIIKKWVKKRIIQFDIFMFRHFHVIL